MRKVGWSVAEVMHCENRTPDQLPHAKAFGNKGELSRLNWLESIAVLSEKLLCGTKISIGNHMILSAFECNYTQIALKACDCLLII